MPFPKDIGIAVSYQLAQMSVFLLGKEPNEAFKIVDGILPLGKLRAEFSSAICGIVSRAVGDPEAAVEWDKTSGGFLQRTGTKASA